MTILNFETKTCGRCGGCGNYSYCQMYGTTCFGCHGHGKVFSKRGRAALAWENEQKQIKISEVKIGQRVRVHGVGTFRVTKSQPSTTIARSTLPDGTVQEHPYWEIGSATPGLGLHAPLDHTVQMIGEKADQIALRRQALEYQNSLTEAGKPRKRRK